MSTDYKKKYIELRSKYMAAIDTSFRMGYEKGAQEGQMQAQQQQMADQQAQMAQAQAAMGQGQVDENGQPLPGQPGQDPSMVQDPSQDPSASQDMAQDPAAQGQPSALDSSIGELQGLLQKGEKPSYVALRDISIKIADLRKAETTRKHTGLQPEQKQEVALQAKIVKDLAKKWKEESKQVANDIKNIL